LLRRQLGLCLRVRCLQRLPWQRRLLKLRLLLLRLRRLPLLLLSLLLLLQSLQAHLLALPLLDALCVALFFHPSLFRPDSIRKRERRVHALQLRIILGRRVSARRLAVCTHPAVSLAVAVVLPVGAVRVLIRWRGWSAAGCLAPTASAAHLHGLERAAVIATTPGGIAFISLTTVTIRIDGTVVSISADAYGSSRRRRWPR